MAEETGTTFTHIGVKKTDRRKIAILAKVQGGNIYEMVGAWADDAWNKAKKKGLVSDAMVQPRPTVNEKIQAKVKEMTKRAEKAGVKA